jgi:hypothetical protein
VTRRYKHLLIAILTLRTLDKRVTSISKKKKTKTGRLYSLSLPGIILDSSSSYVYIFINNNNHSTLFYIL